MIRPMRVIYAKDVTAGAATGTTAIDIAAGGEQYIVSNFDTVNKLYWKLGDGNRTPNASNTTDGIPRMALGPGQSASFSRGANDVKIYFYAIANVDCWVAVGEGM